MKKIFKIAAFVLAAFAFSACTSTTGGGSVGADRGQMMLVSEAAMNEQADSQYAEVIAEARKNHTLNPDLATTERVRNIARRLIAQCGVFRKDALNWNWQVNVIQEDTVNAWCMPGGKIVVYTGIIDALKLTDGELAAIMGHEISHALKEHSREQSSKQVLADIGVSVVSEIAGLGDLGSLALALGVQYGLTLPFSRKCETEADNMGTELMARAGYDPHEAVNVWIKMNKLGGSSVPQILSTHPSNDSRIKNLTEVSETVYPLYRAAAK